MRALDSKRTTPDHHLMAYVLDSINDGVAILDRNGCFDYLNRHCCRILGYKRQELEGKLAIGFLASPSGSVLKEAIQCRNGDPQEPFELIWLNRDKTPVTTIVSVVPVHDADDCFSATIAVITDITGKKAAEEALKKSEANLRAIFNNSLQYFVLLDRQMRIQDFNSVARERAKKFLNLDMKIGDSFTKFVVEETMHDFFRFFDQSLDGVPWTAEVQLKDHHAEPYWVEVNLNAIIEDTGRVSGVCFSLLDINERKLAENALRRSEERYRLLVENSPDAILILRGLSITYVNARAVELLGAGEEQNLLSRSFLDFIHPDRKEDIAKRLNQAIERNSIYPTKEHQLHLDDNQLIDVEINAISFSFRDASALQIIVRDICMRKQAERELISYQQQLRRLASECSLTEEKERHRIATDIHDHIGTTLSLAKIRLENIETMRSGEDAWESLTEVRELIEKALADTRSLTFELSPPVLYELGLKAGIEWLADQMRERHGLKIAIVDDGEQWPIDEDVRGILFRAVRELLFNVVKHARTSKAAVSLRRLGNSLEIEVEDQGAGFDPAAVNARSAVSEGFGLFSLRERLNHMGGRLEIDALPGLGTRVTLVAPLLLLHQPVRSS